MDSLKTNQKFNAIYNRTNGIYHEIVKKYNMSECQFWIFYALYVEQRPLTQGELAEYLIAPKQTVHSAIQKMLDCHYIIFREKSGKRKYYELTEQGNTVADQTVKQVFQNELHVLDQFTCEERDHLIDTLTRFCDLLEKEAL